MLDANAGLLNGHQFVVVLEPDKLRAEARKRLLEEEAKGTHQGTSGSGFFSVSDPAQLIMRPTRQLDRGVVVSEMFAAGLQALSEGPV
jgi:hypothetical protein